jgi:antitoxin component YwqK of YwqJK toxin-antitoxin module
MSGGNNNKILYDISIYCFNKKNNIKEEIKEFPAYSTKQIKSGEKFDLKRKFKIFNLIIEGMYIDDKCFYFIKDCKKNGLYVEFQYNYIENNVNKMNNYKGFLEIFNNYKKGIKCYYKNDKLDGKYKNYNRDGKKEICYYKDGKKEGKYTLYYESGYKYKECEYINDKKNGNYIEFYKNGNQKFIWNFQNDVKSSVLGEWHENGNKKKYY